MNQYSHIRPGDKLPGLPTKAWNALMNSLHAAGNRPGANGVGTSAVEVDVLNVTGSTIPLFGVIGLQGPVADYADDAGTFLDSDQMLGVAPAAGSPFAIVRQALTANDVGRARVLGQTKCKVDVRDISHRYAAPTDSTTELRSQANVGPAILQPPSGGFSATGSQWAVCVLTGHSEQQGGYLKIVSETETAGRRQAVVMREVGFSESTWIEGENVWTWNLAGTSLAIGQIYPFNKFAEETFFGLRQAAVRECCEPDTEGCGDSPCPKFSDGMLVEPKQRICWVSGDDPLGDHGWTFCEEDLNNRMRCDIENALASMLSLALICQAGGEWLWWWVVGHGNVTVNGYNEFYEGNWFGSGPVTGTYGHYGIAWGNPGSAGGAWGGNIRPAWNTVISSLDQHPRPEGTLVSCDPFCYTFDFDVAIFQFHEDRPEFAYRPAVAQGTYRAYFYEAENTECLPEVCEGGSSGGSGPPGSSNCVPVVCEPGLVPTSFTLTFARTSGSGGTGDGQEIELEFFQDFGTEKMWLVETTIDGHDIYAVLTCKNFGLMQVYITGQNPDGSWGTLLGSLTETDPGTWTYLVEDIDFGEGRVYQLAGSWDEADCE